MRNHFFFAFVGFVAMGLVACSEDIPNVPRTYMDMTMGPGAAGAARCNIPSSPWLEAGEPAKPVEDGDANPAGGSVRVQCAVTPSGDGFDVHVIATLSGAGQKNGTVDIQGKMTARGRQENVAAIFTNEAYGRFEAEGCTVEYTTPYQGVAAGRVWGYLTCPSTKKADQDRECKGTGEFKFENCTQ